MRRVYSMDLSGLRNEVLNAISELRQEAQEEELVFQSTLTMEEIEQKFADTDVFSELMEALEEAKVYADRDGVT